MLAFNRERRRFTPEEYLRLEETSEFRSEFHDGEIFAMTGGSVNHDRIIANLRQALDARLAGGSCRTYGSDVKLLVERHVLFTYPDLTVACGGVPLLKGRNDTLIDAKLLIEVLSPSTESYDRGEKFRLYQALPSFLEYVLIAQDKTLVERYLRSGDAWDWKGYVSIDDSLELESVSVAIPLSQIYRNLPVS